MWRSSSKRDAVAWTVILCLLGFGSGFILVRKFRPAGPVEIRELPGSDVKIAPNAKLPHFDSTPPKATSDFTPNPALTNPPPMGSTVESTQKTPREKTKAEPAQQSISINSADLTTLEQLPGVGPGLAQKIIDYRTQNGAFQTVDDLRNVKGIGEKRMAKITPYVRL